MTSRRLRRLLVMAAVLGLAVAVALPLVLWTGRLHPARVPVDDDPGAHGLAYEAIEFGSPVDGTTLRGWYLPAPDPNGGAIVIAPGIDDNRLQSGITLALAPALLEAGFDVLAFDHRAEGESGPGPVTFGAREQDDVLAAVGAVRGRGARWVGVLGFSLGGGAAIEATARSAAIDALVVDSAFFDLEETLRREIERRYGLPGPVASYGLAWYELLSGTRLADVSPGRVIDAIPPRPLLVVHGADDATIPPSDGERLRAAAGLPADGLWVVPGGAHARSYFADPSGYERRLIAFFSGALGQGEP